VFAAYAYCPQCIQKIESLAWVTWSKGAGRLGMLRLHARARARSWRAARARTCASATRASCSTSWSRSTAPTSSTPTWWTRPRTRTPHPARCRSSSRSTGRTACAPPHARACPPPVKPASAGSRMRRAHRGGGSHLHRFHYSTSPVRARWHRCTASACLASAASHVLC